jgi:ABC-type multidrug transport system fused ATPase/permease subunit
VVEIINNITARVSNFISVLTHELTPIFPYEILLGGLLWLVVFYFISRWFKVYIIRVILFILGVSLFYDVMGRSHIITSVDFYISIALFVPHISMVELTYLIIRERILFLIDRTIEIFLLLISPFIWVYEKISNVFQFFKSKQEERENKKAEQEYYKEEFIREQERAYQKEQEKYNQQDKQRQQEEQERIDNKKQYRYKKKEKPQQPKEEPKTYSRWDSSNPYEVLGISENSTKQEIKKAYRNLAKIYHPDLTFSKKEEYTVILQKINKAYERLK